MKKWFLIFLCLSSVVQANCTIYFKNQILKKKMADPLFLLLSNTSSCPGSIQDLKQIMQRNGLQEHISLVANRGRNNPVQGSFSFFESVSGVLSSGQLIKKGDFFIGYFTGLDSGTIILDQQPEDNKLLIEIIAWDKQKSLYNFYELRGLEGDATRWFYRGDSTDAYKDNTWLYRNNPENEPHFGNRMRCSACHNSGGPILKEQSYPHNDWWTTKRPLIFAPNTPDVETLALLEQLIDVDQFAKEVKTGAHRLAKSKKMNHFHKQLTLQEQLRPLFCTTEINLESSLDSPDNRVHIPSSFWLNPLLGHLNLTLSARDYNQLLEDFDMHFPETGLRDADHRWHTPVKGRADIKAIQDLIKRKKISKNFAQAVLMIDFAHPLFSSQRCELLQLLPEGRPKEWSSQFLINLEQKGTVMMSAKLLAEYLKNKKYDNSEFMRIVEEYKQVLAQQLSSYSGLKLSYQRLIDLRQGVYQSELSQNPKGQILEPGFRVIFPEMG